MTTGAGEELRGHVPGTIGEAEIANLVDADLVAAARAQAIAEICAKIRATASASRDGIVSREMRLLADSIDGGLPLE